MKKSKRLRDMRRHKEATDRSTSARRNLCYVRQADLLGGAKGCVIVVDTKGRSVEKSKRLNEAKGVQGKSMKKCLR